MPTLNANIIIVSFIVFRFKNTIAKRNVINSKIKW